MPGTPRGASCGTNRASPTRVDFRSPIPTARSVPQLVYAAVSAQPTKCERPAWRPCLVPGAQALRAAAAARLLSGPRAALAGVPPAPLTRGVRPHCGPSWPRARRVAWPGSPLLARPAAALPRRLRARSLCGRNSPAAPPPPIDMLLTSAAHGAAAPPGRSRPRPRSRPLAPEPLCTGGGGGRAGRAGVCRAARGGRAPGEVWGGGPASRLRSPRDNAEGLCPVRAPLRRPRRPPAWGAFRVRGRAGEGPEGAACGRAGADSLQGIRRKVSRVGKGTEREGDVQWQTKGRSGGAGEVGFLPPREPGPGRPSLSPRGRSPAPTPESERAGRGMEAEGGGWGAGGGVICSAGPRLAPR